MKHIYFLRTLLLFIGVTLFIPKSSISQCVGGGITFKLKASMLGGPRKPADFPMTINNVNGILGFNLTIDIEGNFDGTGTNGAGASPAIGDTVYINALDPNTCTGPTDNFNRFVYRFTGAIKPTNVVVAVENASFFSTTNANGAVQINEQMRVVATRVNPTGTIGIAVTQPDFYNGSNPGPSDYLTITSDNAGANPFVNAVQPLAVATDPRYPFRTSNGFTSTLTDASRFSEISVEYNYENFKVRPPTPTSRSKSNINAFSITVTVPCPVNSTLPANALVLKGVPLNNGSVKLDWSSLSENNTDFYVVERSNDGRNFTRIGNNIRAAGFTATTSNYSSADNDAAFNTVRYYRVVLKDLDGSVSYSNVILVKNSREDNSIIAINPNPAVNSFNLKLTEPGTFQIQLIDARGATVYNTNINNGSANANITINRQAWQAGMYLLKVINTKTNEVKTGRVVLQ